MFRLYQGAATSCPGLSWTVLAAIGKVESDHGRSVEAGVHTGENSAGAAGPMQFLAGTWASYGIDADGDGIADRYEPADAVYGAARYLCANGGGTASGLHDAIYAYNHAEWYVQDVLRQAAAYGAVGPLAPSTADVAALLGNARLTLSEAARQDLASGVVDQQVLGVLTLLLRRHALYISVFKTGHTQHVNGRPGVISNHYFGRAADIALVDGQPVDHRNTAARDVVLALKAMTVSGRRPEVGQPWADLIEAGNGLFTDADHQDHVHVGFLSSQ